MKPSEILLLGVVGSTAYGMAGEDSDIDLKGFCFAPTDCYLGLSSFEVWENPEQDEVIYELKKFVRLAIAGNPSILEMLWLPQYQVLSLEGKAFLGIRSAFLSKRVHQKFSGYAMGQIKKCRQKILDPTSHAGIKAKNPYKHAAHCMRLLRMGIELIETGEMNVNRASIDADELRAIRKGEIPIDTVLTEAEKLISELDRRVDKSPLPDEPDLTTINQVLTNVIYSYLREGMEQKR